MYIKRKVMIRNGILHRLILLVAISICSYIYLIEIGRPSLGLFDLIAFTAITAILIFGFLMPELRILFKKQIIARTIKFDPMNLLFLLVVIPNLIFADYESIDSDLSKIDDNFFLAFLWFSIIFLRRNKYYTLTDRFIGYHNYNGVFGTSNIYFKDIIEIEDNIDIILIKSNKKTLKIEMNKIINVDKETFRKKIDGLKNTVHNNVYTK